MSSSRLLEEGQEEQAMEHARVPDHRPPRVSVPRLRGGAGEEKIIIGVAGGCCFFFVLVSVCISMFSAVIKPNHVGISYNSLTKHSDLDKTFAPGRHFPNWPSKSFILFPTTVQNVHLDSLISRTNEGFPITLSVTVQYLLMKDKIIQIYKEYNIKYEQVYIRNIRDAMMRAISEYSAKDFYAKRKQILQEMKKLLTVRLEREYANVWDIQFNDVKQSQMFEDSLVRAQLQTWFAKTKTQEQAVSAVKAHTAVIKADFDKNISIVNSTATSQCSYIQSTATASASIYTQEADANATLIIDQAKATGTRIVQEALSKAELVYQTGLAEGNAHVLQEKAHADQRETSLAGLRLKYWTDIVGLSDAGVLAFQKLVGNVYKKLENVEFLFGFKNTYATADVGKTSQTGMPSSAASMGQAIELAAISGNAAGSAAAEQDPSDLPSSAASAAAVSPAAAPRHLAEDYPNEIRMNGLQMPQWTELEL